MKRIALLGATGSIGRQAIEVIDAHPELELVAAASGLAADRRARAAHADRRRPHRAARARRARPRAERGRRLRRASRRRCGRSSAASRSRSRTRRASSRPASSRSRAQERGGGALIPVDSEHSALFQCAQLGEPESLVLTASGGPFRGRTRDELDGRHARGGARAPDLEHGPEDHDRLRDARQQGPRGDRGALPLRRRLRPDRGRDPPDLDRARPRPLPRRRVDRAPRLPRHARPDLLRAHLPGARRRRRCRRSSCARSSSTSPTPRRSACSRSAARPASGAAPTPAPTTPRTRSPCRRSSSGGSASSRSPRSSRTCSRASTAPPARDLDELRRGRPPRPRAGAGRLMGIAAAILGLARPDPRPRGGPLLRRALGRDAAAEVLPRLRPAAREDDARTASSTASRRSRSAAT